MRQSLTKIEIKAVDRLRRAFGSLPKTLNVYVVDDGVLVCKIAVPSADICEQVGFANPGAVLTDIHDRVHCGQI